MIAFSMFEKLNRDLEDKQKKSETILGINRDEKYSRLDIAEEMINRPDIRIKENYPKQNTKIIKN